MFDKKLFCFWIVALAVLFWVSVLLTTTVMGLAPFALSWISILLLQISVVAPWLPVYYLIKTATEANKKQNTGVDMANIPIIEPGPNVEQIKGETIDGA